MMRRSTSVLCAMAASLVVAACEPTGSGVTAPPAGTETYDFVGVQPGTTIVYRRTSADSDTSETYTVDDITTYRGRSAYKLVSGDGSLSYYDAATSNWMAGYDPNGVLQTSAMPHNGRYKFPLWVGKSWRAEYDFTNHEKGRTWYDLSPTYEVEAVETITVPAGTFKTLRIQSGPGRNVGFIETIWYSPELGVSVRRVYERTAEHYLGSGGHRETVLVSFEPKMMN